MVVLNFHFRTQGAFMTAKNFSTVASDLITSYGNTASHVIEAVAAGGDRLVTGLEQRWNRALKEQRSELTAEVAKNAAAAQMAFSAYYSKGLTMTTQGAQQVVSQVTKLMEAGVDRAAANASSFEEKTGTRVLSGVAAATAPGLLALSKLAAQVEDKTAALASGVAGSARATGKRASAFSQRRAARTA
jgi:hypothetical protein